MTFWGGRFREKGKFRRENKVRNSMGSLVVSHMCGLWLMGWRKKGGRGRAKANVGSFGGCAFSQFIRVDRSVKWKGLLESSGL